MARLNLFLCVALGLALSGQTSLLQAQAFVRGDANDDSRHDIADAITVLTFLFGGGGLQCRGEGSLSATISPGSIQ